MKRVLLTLSLLVPFGPAMATPYSGIASGPPLPGFPAHVCPSTIGITVGGVAGSASDCTEELVVTNASAGSTLTVQLVPGNSTHGISYESDEDVLVGVWNSPTSGGSVTSIHIQGTGINGDGVTSDSFGFDGDGVGLLTGIIQPGDTSGNYAGPNTSFSYDLSDLSQGDVIFTGNGGSGLAPGDTAYFSLEYPVVSGTDNVPPGGGGGQTGVPEPASMALLGAALLGLGAVRRRR